MINSSQKQIKIKKKKKEAKLDPVDCSRLGTKEEKTS